MQVETFNEHATYTILDVKPIIEALESYIPIGYSEISVAFVTEQTICSLHERFLQNPDPTDVITFPAANKDEEKMGEICISVDEALKYCNKIHSLEDELTLYLVHGWLHLAHYDDIKEEDRLIMRQKEKEVLEFLQTQKIPRIILKQ